MCNGKRGFMPELMAWRFAIAISIMGVAGCGSMLAPHLDDGRAMSDSGGHCSIALLNLKIKQAGTFFGSSVKGDYQFEYAYTGKGPWLLFRPKDHPFEKESIIYATSEVSSTCDEFLIEFDEVVKVPTPYWSMAWFKPVDPSRRIQFRAKLFHTQSDGNDMKKNDLGVEIYSDDGKVSIEKFTMYRAERFTLPSTDKKIADAKTLEKMSREICDLIINVVSKPDAHEKCVSTMRGLSQNFE
jgi:hypothetical protein